MDIDRVVVGRFLRKACKKTNGSRTWSGRVRQARGLLLKTAIMRGRYTHDEWSSQVSCIQDIMIRRRKQWHRCPRPVGDRARVERAVSQWTIAAWGGPYDDYQTTSHGTPPAVSLSACFTLTFRFTLWSLDVYLPRVVFASFLMWCYWGPSCPFIINFSARSRSLQGES